jgi:predicted enzyme related to lactoylglutathione lyase
LSGVAGTPADIRFTMPNGLELAAVGNALIVAGGGEALAPCRSTQAALAVDDLDGCQSLLARAGARVLRGPRRVPAGRNLTARLPGGIHIECVERDRAQRDRVGGAEPHAAAG